MSFYHDQIEGLQLHLRSIAGLDDILATEKFAHVDKEMIDMMLDQSARFAKEKLVPLARTGDIDGCILDNGTVKLPPGTVDIYNEWCELGFPSLGLPMDFNGMDFPLVVQSAVQEILDGSNLAFGMMGINLRCAARALIANAHDDLVQQWVPGLVSGDITSTIVISEALAGSDVGRIRTTATPGDNGQWSLTGEKIWISYGDHDLSEQIIHLVLAKVPGNEVGTRALSLFAVPKLLDDGSANGVAVSRLEHKMGLHASPTCVLELDKARGFLIGEAGQGLQALFIMMNAMRLGVGVQGAAVANAATLHALDYARERPQGGRPDAPALMISEHADVKRMLLEMTAHSEMIRALALKTAWFLDMADAGEETETARQHLRLGELLLPVAKTVGAETAFTIASQGIQVLGGYGYTNDYPLERLARDIRVASIYEGTSGIQAKDFLMRKVVADEGATLATLTALVNSDLANTGKDNPLTASVTAALASLEATTAELLARAKLDRKAVEPGAYHFLQLSGLVVTHWQGLSLHEAATENTAYQLRLKAALAQAAVALPETAARLAKLALQPGFAGTL